MIDLNHLRIFERVASHRGFSAAARELGLPRSNVSRAVAKLEEALGTRLMQRTTRAVALTPAGRALSERATALMADLDATLLDLEELTGVPSGPLRVTAGIGLGVNFLGDVLPTFLRRYPDVELFLQLESARVDLVADRIDVALRFGPLPDSTLVSQQIGKLERTLCAAPDYLAVAGTPHHPEDLVAHRIVDLPTPDARPRQWHFDGMAGPVTVSLRPTVCVDEVLTLHKLVRGGAGIGIVSTYLCADELAENRLVHLLPDWKLPAVPLSLIFPSRRELAPSVRAFSDFMREVAKDAPWSRIERMTAVSARGGA